ncbi:hypothetical protein FPSE_11918 [Fusarium pseudograminearum CS3096]|uniref:Uncharacterized protein n=1 Tax=Fusarium pseudograminearum (strain CS3096) TaxID=1028729 RepID=K3V4U7_FUSPC|nr:hypothetical protein FPSE_11918 [Fusarium pseudograminearum CS3096]EKJ67909.1 hypothetical protein FPSE_11918 [Fusarium pseudograminearum CS3096]
MALVKLQRAPASYAEGCYAIESRNLFQPEEIRRASNDPGLSANVNGDAATLPRSTWIVQIQATRLKICLDTKNGFAAKSACMELYDTIPISKLHSLRYIQ